ncbi:16S rRNA (guanine(966)-N(2))-methyltransferase RsmD [Paracidovorax valerianellae]|uniref:16S rRNA (Guanine(966)-N(2))-methyltransferase RsmD n=1 Tax=Paracidovorax valerianellae TaxID=187868 RepID=A0A1G6PKE4_9BURK|nr:16S rRNA (guanine(966)-N(2))-methyltransferase RsmD [Paracidovorax valerianellae]MDA8444891.1 16S rRNA (guanine(966)-N(2))-methyltransferase RsmD [Paracidovorax valerianellae]SDC79986.1 16S rRNA (guanine(966)-N(2))-methyltransferase RsmD [Paracidovorax valerianellae]
MSRPARRAAPAAPAPAAKKTVAKGAGEVRIIGGQWKRTRLPVAQRPGLRPTPDRVRETLFNWLGQDMTGWRCLDAFAGTGALGFEAASRGAAAVQLVENDPALVDQLHTLQQRLQAMAVRVQRGDGVAALRHCAPGSLHLVFIDPPFESALFEPALAAASQAVAADGFIYLEAPQAWDDAALAAVGLAVHRHLKAGAVHAHLLKKQ